MKCLSCGSPGAYFGGNSNAECPNEDCPHHDPETMRKGLDLATGTINGDPILEVRLHQRKLKAERQKRSPW